MEKIWHCNFKMLSSALAAVGTLHFQDFILNAVYPYVSLSNYVLCAS